MTVESETLILKAIDELKGTLNKFIETTNQKFDDFNTSLTSIQVNQAKLEGEVKTLDVKIENLQKGQDELNADLSTFKAETKENFKELKTEIKETKDELTSEIKDVRLELKETRSDVSSLYKWVIGLILTFGIGIITLGIGVVTIIFRVFDLFPKA